VKTDPSLPELLKNNWKHSGLAVRKGVTNEDIQRFEMQHSVQLPQDLARYFETVDGMEEGDTDAHDIRFWRLEEVQPVSVEVPNADLEQSAGYFVFADYSIWAHGYAIQLLHEGNQVAIVGGARPIPIAQSFEEFLNLYLYQPEKLF
jgi:hypothetical protein